MPDGSYTPTTWQVQFELPEVSTQGFYNLLIATASSSTAAIQVRCHVIPNFPSKAAKYGFYIIDRIKYYLNSLWGFL